MGQHQDPKATTEAVFQHAKKFRVHERFAAGKPDLFRSPSMALDLVRGGRNCIVREIDEAVVPGTRFDIAVAASDVAKRAGVEPQRSQPLQRDVRAWLTRRGEIGVLELLRRKLRHHVAIAAGPKLGANRRAPAARCLLRSQRARPKRTAWLEGCAALVNLFQRQYLAAGPEAGFERGCILFGQAGTVNFGGGRGEIVVERPMLDHDAIRFGSQEAEPYPRRPVVRGHSNGASIMPELPVDRLSEWQAAVTGNDTVNPCLPDLLKLDCSRAGRKDEAVDDIDAAMHHGKPMAGDFKVKAPRQVGHPSSCIG